MGLSANTARITRTKTASGVTAISVASSKIPRNSCFAMSAIWPTIPTVSTHHLPPSQKMRTGLYFTFLIHTLNICLNLMNRCY